MVEATQWLLQTSVRNNISLKYQTINKNYGESAPALTGSFHRTIMCRDGYMMYVVMNYGSTNRFLRISLLSGKTEWLFDKTDDQLYPDSSTRYPGDILSDGTYMYVSSSPYSYALSISKIEISTGVVYKFKDTTTDSHRNNSAGTMYWADDNTIHVLCKGGPLQFNTSDGSFDASLLASSFQNWNYCNWVTKTKYHYLYHNNKNVVQAYNIKNKQMINVNLEAEMYTCGVYDEKNDKIYVFGTTSDTGKIYTFTETETTITRDSTVIAAPWLNSKPRNMCMTDNGMIFLFIQGSNIMYIYNTNNGTYHSDILQYAAPGAPADNGLTMLRSIQYNSMVFVPYTTLGYFIYHPSAKYNVGFKNDKQFRNTTSEQSSDFTYDSNVVEFKNMYMTIKNGNIVKSLIPINEDDNTIKKCHMDKSEYRSLVSVSPTVSNDDP